MTPRTYLRRASKHSHLAAQLYLENVSSDGLTVTYTHDIAEACVFQADQRSSFEAAYPHINGQWVQSEHEYRRVQSGVRCRYLGPARPSP